MEEFEKLMAESFQSDLLASGSESIEGSSTASSAADDNSSESENSAGADETTTAESAIDVQAEAPAVIKPE
jgi:hypothetical protein